MFSPTQIQSFVTAVEEGTLSAAARKLGVTQPAVSQHLAQLEKAAGEALIVRTRHGVRTTRAGEIMLAHGTAILSEMARISEGLDALRGKVSGVLTVSTNMVFNQTLMMPIFMDLQREHPDLRLILRPTDTFLDVETDGIDIAVRAGSTGEGSGVVRRVAALETALVASPDYLSKIGHPAGPEDLVRHHYIQYKKDADQTHLDLEIGGELVPVPITPAFDAQDPNLVMHALESGIGYARLPRFMVAEALESGALAELLPATPPGPKPIFLVQAAHTVETRRNALFRAKLFGEIDRGAYMSLSATARQELQEAEDDLTPCDRVPRQSATAGL